MVENENTKSFNRLIVVSNRLPVSIKKSENGTEVVRSSGGLVTAIESLITKQEEGFEFKEVIWFGTGDFSSSLWMESQNLLGNLPYKINPLFIDKHLYEDYYNGFSNSTLWPLFHYFPSLTEYHEKEYQAFKQVNHLFAEELINKWQPGDFIWIHDYHLMLLPKLLRDLKPEIKIGFFLHIPFPSFELFRLLPKQWRESILLGTLGSDVVGFHTDSYAGHFLKSLRQLLGKDSQYRILNENGRFVKVDVFPISIDFDKFNSSLDNPEVIEIRDKLADQYKNKKIIFSVDRLDYTKGLVSRLTAYECFLENNPEWQENVVFIFVLIPSRDRIAKYSELKSSVEGLVSKINGRLGNINWQPIVYQYRSLSDVELRALFTVCHVALITPLRDGMNLVAKEFVASRKDKKGVLILSEMAGAASEFSEALLINPTDRNEIADKIRIALEMPEQEQDHRISLMQERVRNYNVYNWAQDFFVQTRNTILMQQKQKVRYLDQATKRRLIEAYEKAESRLLLLDYDGTLAEFNVDPGKATPSNELKIILQTLASDPRNDVTIISGRDANFLETHLGDLPVSLVAEHGAMVRMKDGEWVTAIQKSSEWKKILMPILQNFVHRCPHSFIEEKKHGLAWHYRKAEADLGFIRSRELVSTLHEVVNSNDIKIIDGSKTVEIKNLGIDKGTISHQIASEKNFDFVIAIGDDKTDEDMFKALQDDNHFTIKVGDAQSAAKYYLLNVSEVYFLLALLKSRVPA